VTLHVERLFELRIEHGYFDGGTCRIAAVRPLASCTALLERYRLEWAATPGGGSLHQWVDDPPGDAGTLGQRWMESRPLRFGVWVSDPYFRRRTDGGCAWEWGRPDEEGWPLHFSNDVVHAAGARSAVDGFLLHDADTPCRRRISPADLAGELAPTAALPFAVVSIHVMDGEDPALPADAAILDAQRVLTPRRYRIALPARRALVRYLITRPPAASGAVQLAVEGATNVVFSPTTSAADADASFAFLSDQPLPLHESPRRDYRMVMTDGSGRRTMLPYARAECAYLEASGEGAPPHFVCEVHVHA